MTMTFFEFLQYVGVVAVLMALVSAVEFALPLYRRPANARGRAPANLALTLLVFTLNWLLLTGVAALLLMSSLEGSAGSALFRLPAVTQVLLGVAILDFCTYVAHFCMHKIPLLWRFHRVHHSDRFVDVTTSFRLHPLEGLWRFLWIVVPALTFGIPAHALVIYRLLSMVNAVLEHANIAVPRKVDRAISWAWVTPNMHKIHHSSAQAQTDTNYGNLFSWFDRVFRTFTPTDRAFGVQYGLGDSNPEGVGSLRALLRMPFQSKVGTFAAQPAQDVS